MPYQDFVPERKGAASGGEGSGFTDFIPAKEEVKKEEVKLNPRPEVKEKDAPKLKPIEKEPVEDEKKSD